MDLSNEMVFEKDELAAIRRAKLFCRSPLLTVQAIEAKEEEQPSMQASGATLACDYRHQHRNTSGLLIAISGEMTTARSIYSFIEKGIWSGPLHALKLAARQATTGNGSKYADSMLRYATL